MKRISGVLALVAVIMLIMPTAQAVGPEVLVAHRGFGGAAQVKYNVPENSIKAWGKAIAGALRPTIIDLDLQLTSDNVPIVMHDDHLERTTNGSGDTDDRSWAYVSKLWLELPIDRDGNGNDDNTDQRVPRFTTALDFLKDKTIDGVPVLVTVEPKGYWSATQINKIKTYASQRGMLDRVLIHAQSLTTMKYAKAAGFPKRGYVTPSKGPFASVSTIKNVGSYAFVKLTLAETNPDKISEYKAAGIKVFIWTMSSKGDIDRALALPDFYALVCDDSLEAQEYLADADALA